MEQGVKSSRTSAGQSRRWRTLLVPFLIVFLFLAAIVASKYFTGSRWRIRAVLRLEAEALEAGDREAFLSLQDAADQEWLRNQRNTVDSRIWAQEHNIQADLGPVPRPRIVEVEQHGEEAWVEVETEQWGETRRKVEFFRLVDGEWKHTGPDERYWGEPREAHTEHLHWIYRARDEEWVTGLFDSAEQVYRRICADFGLDPAGQQVTIEVVYALDRAYLPLYPEEPVLPMPSPRLVGLNEETAEDLPASLLLNYLGVQAAGGDPSVLTQADRTVLDAVESWEADQLSLNDWWVAYGVPQLSAALEAGEMWPLAEVWGEGETQGYTLAHVQSYSAIEYLVDRYGAERIPTLLQSLGAQTTVEQALQAALGPDFVSEDFDAGWRAWIWERYGPPGTPPAFTPAPAESPAAAPTSTSALSLPATPLPLPSLEGVEGYRTTMRAGHEDEVQYLTGLPHYDLALEADLDAGTLMGRERLILANRESTALDGVLLRLYPNCSQAGSMVVGGITSDGQAADFSDQAGGTAVLVSLPGPLAPGESTTLEMDFAVRLDVQTEDVWSAAFFYPMLAVYQDGQWRQDAISSGPDAVFSESASYAVRLTAPDPIKVAASGVEVDTEDNADGTITHAYRGGPLRGFALFMSEGFQVHQDTVDGVVVNTWAHRGEEELAEEILSYTTDAVGVFDERFGPYPYGELDVVAVHDVRLPADMVTGVEYPGLVTVLHGGDAAPSPGGPEFPAVHEVAHQWWYAVVGNDVLLEPWLDESFANYSVVIYYEDVYGQEMAGEVYRDRIVGAYERIQGTGQDGPVGRSVYDFAESAQPSGPILYGKGAVFLHTLRQEVGDEAFFAILRHRYQRYKYQVATGEELLTDAEEVTGRELDELFDTWIRSTRRPEGMLPGRYHFEREGVTVAVPGPWKLSWELQDP
jgi:hypothetical protein